MGGKTFFLQGLGFIALFGLFSVFGADISGNATAFMIVFCFVFMILAEHSRIHLASWRTWIDEYEKEANACTDPDQSEVIEASANLMREYFYRK
jgi:hypothetical protein